jgi:hypothetical protein
LYVKELHIKIHPRIYIAWSKDRQLKLVVEHKIHPKHIEKKINDFECSKTRKLFFYYKIFYFARPTLGTVPTAIYIAMPVGESGQAETNLIRSDKF